KMRSCPRCGAELRAGAKFCHKCGAPIIHEAPPQKLITKRERKILLPVAIIIVIILAVFVGYYYHPWMFRRGEVVVLPPDEAVYFEPSKYNGVWEGTLEGKWVFPARPVEKLATGYQSTWEYKAKVRLIAKGEGEVWGNPIQTDFKGTANITIRLVDLKASPDMKLTTTSFELKNVPIHGYIIDCPQESCLLREPKQILFNQDVSVVLVFKTPYEPFTHTMHLETGFSESPGVLNEFTFIEKSKDTLELSHLKIEPPLYDTVIEESGVLRKISPLPPYIVVDGPAPSFKIVRAGKELLLWWGANHTEDLNKGDLIIGGTDWAWIAFPDGSVGRIEEGSKLMLEDNNIVKLISGKLWVYAADSFTVKTGACIMEAKKCEFSLETSEEGVTNLVVIEGTLYVSDPNKREMRPVGVHQALTVKPNEVLPGPRTVSAEEVDKWWERAPSLPISDRASGPEPVPRYPSSVMLGYKTFVVENETWVDVVYGTKESISMVADWYKTQMQNAGWRLMEEYSGGIHGDLTFYRGREQLYVSVGYCYGYTLVEINYSTTTQIYGGVQ
ncbi:MAG TPA: zinc-ribbon domain-containing protein, partial [Desulfobacterales bacterium]|nr:zinc-ribbon domain-containing protein [Desulfobacterales bacterium]